MNYAQDTKSDAADRGTVLVTGGSGYLASWTVVQLLDMGYHVRTTVRDLSREGQVRAAIANGTAAYSKFSVVQADLKHDEGWDRATAGADYVVHVASPMPVGKYRGTDLVGPAVEGTHRVLSAARAAGVRRVVLTSSAEAATPKDSTSVADESVWTDADLNGVSDYRRAKTLAEREAWAIVEGQDAMELVSILPCFMQGPVLADYVPPSVGIVAMLLSGKLPAIPRIGWPIVDVRDIADLHIRAMLAPAAAGERFMGGNEFLWVEDIARILRTHLNQEDSHRVPRRILPDFIVRLGALVNSDMKEMTPRLRAEYPVSWAKAEQILDWKPRPATDSILDGAKSLLGKGLV